MRAVKRVTGKCCYHSTTTTTTTSASTTKGPYSVRPAIRISSSSCSSSPSSRPYPQTSTSVASSKSFRPNQGGQCDADTNRDKGNDAPFKLTNSILYGLPMTLAVILYLNTLQAGFVYDDHRAVLGNRDVVGSGPWWWVCIHDFWGSPLSRKGSHGSWRPLTTLSFRWNVMVAGLLSREDENFTGVDIDGSSSSSFASSSNSVPPVGPLPFPSPVPTSSSVPSLSPSLSAAFSALSFHAFNVLLHASVTVTYVGVLQFVGVGRWTCLGAGTLFATHPVHVEAVAGVVGRAELLAALAFCLALAAYVNYLHGRSGTRRVWGRRISGCSHTCLCREVHHSSPTLSSTLVSWSPKSGRWLQLPSWAWLGMSVGGAGVAMTFKEQGVTALGVGLMLHAATVVTLTPRSKSLILALIRELWPGTVGAVSLILLRLSISSHTPTFTPTDNPVAHAPSLFTRVLSIAHTWAVHGRLLLCPSTLSFDWSMGSVPLVHSFTDRANLDTLLLLVLLLTVAASTFRTCWRSRPRSPSYTSKVFAYYAPPAYHDMLNNNVLHQDVPASVLSAYNLNNHHHYHHHHHHHHHHPLSSCRLPHHLQLVLAWALLVVPFLPASNLVAYVGFVVAERVLYLPSMGASLLVALGGQALWLHFSSEKCHQAAAQSRSRRSKRRSLRTALSVAWIMTLIFLSAKTVRRNQDWHSDETLYRSGVKVNPPKALSNLGVVYSEQGRLKEAELAYREALRHAPTMADTHYNLGLLLASTGQMEKAIESYRAALRSRPWLAQAHLALAVALQTLDQQDNAIKVLEECRYTSSAPARDAWSHAWAVTRCHKRLAHAYILAGRPHAALEEVSMALLNAPDGFPVHTLHTMIAEAHLEAGEYREAQEVLSKVLAHHPHHVPAHLAFSRMLQANGSRVEEAEQWLRRAVALAPSDPHAHKHLGQLLLEQNRVEEAVQTWLRAAMLDSQDHTAAFNAATALRLAGSNHHAESFYRRAVQLQPQDVASHRNLGAILHLNGKLEEARRHYQVALTLSPGDPQTTTNLHRLTSLMNKKGIS